MQLPKCNYEDVVKNGHLYGKQCDRCKKCDRQFVQTYSEHGHSEDAKQICLTNVL
ncbi:IS1/IS1595 family N-terminal zinc-binding domain-containing protein [Microcoleus vaginatus]|uniref:IS1/IS1595 family N-terminal zinc-binding domain-containing protein n=1 Tax=Microcoleus vaginatus TaxID=119532 RepID=UPI00403F446F